MNIPFLSKNGKSVYNATMKNHNSGLAPLAIVLILVALAVVGGGVYIATTVSKTPVPGTPKPVAVAVKFATVAEATASGKNVTCTTAWFSEKGPDLYRVHFTISSNKVTIRTETNSAGKITSTEKIYLSSDPSYATILKSSLSTAICTQL